MATLEQIIDEARALSPAEKLKLRQALDHQLAQAAPAQSRAIESIWVERNRDKYLGQWVALEGDTLIALADDNFYPVTLTDISLAEAQNNTHRVNELKAIRAERFELMARLAQLPPDTIFFTQITMEAAEDTDFLQAMNKAHITSNRKRISFSTRLLGGAGACSASLKKPAIVPRLSAGSEQWLRLQTDGSA